MVPGFSDRRQSLPRHPTITFAPRDPAELLGVVWHHSAGSEGVEAVAAYHVGPNHISAQGTPGINYSFFLTPSGEVVWCHDLSASTWSQGGGRVPFPGTMANTHYLAICFQGHFALPGPSGVGQPTLPQLLAVLALQLHLVGESRDPGLPEALFGAVTFPAYALWAHQDFSATSCPGGLLATLSAAARQPSGLTGNLESAAQWQQALVSRGYNLGPYGPAGDGVDGLWGPSSADGLRTFQRDQGLPETGRGDWASAQKLLKR